VGLGFVLRAQAFWGLKILLNKSDFIRAGAGLYYINQKVGVWVLFSKKPKLKPKGRAWAQARPNLWSLLGDTYLYLKKGCYVLCNIEFQNVDLK
jgi:hypothetical protein